MENVIYVVKIGLTAVGGVLAGIMGGFDMLLIFFISLIVLDMVTGCLLALKNGEYHSSVMKWGLVNKLIELAVIALFHELDQVLNIDLLRNGAIIWFAISEAASLLENLLKMDIDIPEGLAEILNQFKKSMSVNITEIVKKIISEKRGDK